MIIGGSRSIRHICKYFVRIFVAVFCGFSVSFGGCSALDSADVRLERMVRESSDATGTQGTPGLGAARGADEDQASLRRRPGTVNPGAEDLRYVPAEEARAASARLAVERNAVDGATSLSLSDAFREGQKNARELRSAEDDYLLSAIGVLAAMRSCRCTPSRCKAKHRRCTRDCSSP